MGGLFAANLLLRAGWDVELYERVGEELAGRGAGIVTHAELFDVIRRAGATIDDTIGCATHSRVTLDRNGQVVAEIPLHQILTAWGRLYRQMKDVFPAARYHFNKSLVRVEHGDARHVVLLPKPVVGEGGLDVGRVVDVLHVEVERRASSDRRAKLLSRRMSSWWKVLDARRVGRAVRAVEAVAIRVVEVEVVLQRRGGAGR